MELIRAAIDAWNRRDLDGILELFDERAEYVNAPTAIEPGTRHGREGLTSVFLAQWEGMGGALMDLDRVEVRDGEVLTAGYVSRDMPGSDSVVTVRVLMGWTIAGGSVLRLRVIGTESDFEDALGRENLWQ